MKKNFDKELGKLLAEQAKLTERQAEIERLLELEETPLADLPELTQERSANEQILSAIAPRITTIRTAIREQRERENAARVLALRPRELKTIQAFESWLADGVKVHDDCRSMAAEIGTGARCIPHRELEWLVRHFHGQVVAGTSVINQYTDWSGK
jgi:hypothetical protein